MATFGFIVEGPTDSAVLENILTGFFNDSDLITRQVQPQLDETGSRQATSQPGGWFKVLDFCRSDAFPGLFEQNDFVVIQIDTDRSEDVHFEIKQKNEAGENLQVSELVAAVKNRIKSLIINKFGQNLMDEIAARLLFAISVNELECWLLPLVRTDKMAGATNNCIFKFNEKSEVKINAADKKPRIYEAVSRPFCKPKILFAKGPKNPSLALFLEELKPVLLSEIFQKTLVKSS